MGGQVSVICNYSVVAGTGDTCSSIADSWGISLDNFESLNPGVACPTVVVGQEYCVLGSVTTITPTSTPTPTSTATSTFSTFSTFTTSTTSTVSITVTSKPPAQTGVTPSPDGTCGPGSKGSYTCLGSKYDSCCSVWGYCGGDSDFCGAGCQPGFGDCGVPSTDGTCGSQTNGLYTCAGSTHGNCCSVFGYCGEDSDFCGSGCQTGFGDCGIPSVDGECGSQTNGLYSCEGSGHGSCCSVFGYCGDDYDFCGAGCQHGFGDCGIVRTVSPDGTCGDTSAGDYTCSGSAFGHCCSQWGYCGSTSDYCGDKCQPSFGTCT